MEMERHVFSQPGIGDALAGSYVAVKINTDTFPAVAGRYGVQRLPTDVILAPDGRVLTKLEGATDSRGYVERLTRVASVNRPMQAPSMDYAARSQAVGSSANAAAAYATTPGQPAGQSNGFTNDTNPAAAATRNEPHASASDCCEERGNRFTATPNRYPQHSGGQSHHPAMNPTRQPADMPVGSNHAGAAGGHSSQGQYTDWTQNPGVSRHGSQVQSNTGYSMNPPVASNQAAAGAGAGRSPYQSPPQQHQIASASDPRASANPNASAWPSSSETQRQRVAFQPPENRPPTNAQVNGPPQTAQLGRPVSQPARPTMGLEGYCPVSLMNKQQWVAGNPQIGVTHRGRTYLFAGEAERQMFMADPDRYSPVAEGHDPVLALSGQMVPGNRRHGVYFRNRVYLFASDQSLNVFSQDPDRYAAQILEAMRQAPDTNRR
jgi:YHS domain-containing protein